MDTYDTRIAALHEAPKPSSGRWQEGECFEERAPCRASIFSASPQLRVLEGSADLLQEIYCRRAHFSFQSFDLGAAKRPSPSSHFGFSRVHWMHLRSECSKVSGGRLRGGRPALFISE